MICGVKKRRSGTKGHGFPDLDPNASVHYGAVTCTGKIHKAKKRKSESLSAQDTENLASNTGLKHLRAQQSAMVAMATGNTSVSTCSRKKTGCLRTRQRHHLQKKHKTHHVPVDSRLKTGDKVASTITPKGLPCHGVKPVVLFSPAAAHQDLMMSEDSYSGMSLSFQSSAFTASLSSADFDRSHSMDSDIHPYNTYCSITHSRLQTTGSWTTKKRSENTRPQPVGAADTSLDTLYGDIIVSSSAQDDTISSDKHQTESGSIKGSADTSSQDGRNSTVAVATGSVDSHVALATKENERYDCGPSRDATANSSTTLLEVTGNSSKEEYSRSLYQNVPSVIGNLGQLKISVSLDEGVQSTLLIKVLEGKNLKTRNSFVETHVVPEKASLRQRSATQRDTSSPQYQHSITVEMSEGIQNHRLVMSVYDEIKGEVAGKKESCSNLIGCMSFKLKSLLAKAKKQQKSSPSTTEGWYYLLPDSLGHAKHAPVSIATRRPLPPTPEDKENRGLPKKVFSPQGYAESPKASPMKVVIPKTEAGYGFTVKGAAPVKVGRVTPSSSSHKAGLRQGDIILRINGQDVTKKKSTHVAKVVRDSLTQIALDLLRPKAKPLQSFQDDNISSGVPSLCTCPAQQPAENVQSRLMPPLTEDISSRLPWQPQLSIINEEMTCVEQNDTLLYNETGPKGDSLLYNESRQESSSADSTKWDPDLSHIPHMQSLNNPFIYESQCQSASHSNLYDQLEETDEEISEDENSAFWQLPESMLLEETGYHGNQVSMVTDHSLANHSMESDGLSEWSEESTINKDIPDSQAFLEKIAEMEQSFVALMRHGMEKFSRPLRHRFLPAHQHNVLFQNLEKLALLSECHARELTKPSNQSHVTILTNVYNQKLHITCEAYQTYLSGLPRALTVLQGLHKDQDFMTFLQRAYHQDFQVTLDSFLEKPVEHLLQLLSILELTRETCHTSHPDVTALDDILAALRGSVENAAQSDRKQSNPKYASSSSLDSGISQCSSSASLNKPHPQGSAHQTSSHAHSELNGSSGYMSMIGTSRLGETHTRSSFQDSANCSQELGMSRMCPPSVDQQLSELQRRLLFPANIKPISVAIPQRHVVFSSELECQSSKSSLQSKAQCWLCNDLLLLTTPPTASSHPIRMLASPVLLNDVQDMDFGADDSCDFTITTKSASHGSQVVHMRAPSVGEKFAWRSLLQHHVKSSRGLTGSRTHQNAGPQSCFL